MESTMESKNADLWGCWDHVAYLQSFLECVLFFCFARGARRVRILSRISLLIRCALYECQRVVQLSSVYWL